MPVLKWLRSVTDGLFATCERPIFLVVDFYNGDFSNTVCNFITILGGDVIRLCKVESIPLADYNLYECVLSVFLQKNRIKLVLKRTKNSKTKIFKKTFALEELGL